MTAEPETTTERELRTARHLARTAMEVMTDDQLAEVRERMDRAEKAASEITDAEVGAALRRVLRRARKEPA